METKVNKLPKSEVEIEVELSADEFERHYGDALGMIGSAMKFDGFRPGKAPKEMVEKNAGAKAVLDEAINLAVKKSVEDIFLKESLIPVSQPQISVLKVAKGSPFVFKLKMAVLPKVELADYKKIAKKTPKNEQEIKIDEAEINDALNYIQSSQAKYITVNRPAQKGDRVEMDFVARKEGKELAGGKSENHAIVLGRSKFISGFDDNLVGMKENDGKTFSLNFPVDYHERDLAGKPVDFEIKMKLVQKIELPELNDEFAKKVGKFENIGQLKQSIVDGIKQEKEAKVKDARRREILNKIVQASRVEIPDILIDGEIEKMFADFKNNAVRMGLTFEGYLSHLKKSEQDLRKDWRGQAEKNVRAGLVLGEIAQKENIKPNDQEIEEESNRILLQFKNIGQTEQKFDTKALRDYTENILKNEKVFQYMENL